MRKSLKQELSTSALDSAKPTTVPKPLASAAMGATPHARKRRRARIDMSAAVTTTKTASAPAPKPKRPPENVTPANSPRRSKTPGPTPKPSPNRRRFSALDAAAQILASLTADEAKLGITAQALIERMAKQKLWTSPGGKTPQATLYAAMVREITAKGAAARFRKVSKGHFAAAGSDDRASTSSARETASATRKRIKP